MATRTSKTNKKDPGAVEVAAVDRGEIGIWVLGESPIITNRMSQKAMRELLFPSPKMNAVEKRTHLKHHPIQEFRESPYIIREDDSPTLIGLPATAFKGSMGTAALDLEGVKKAQVGRLVWVRGVYVPIWGIPEMFMAIVRQADMSRTPDVRTRAILPRWAAFLSITYIKPLMAHQAVANLLAAAGLTAGVGDWRPEKGKGNFGQFRLVNEDDPELLEIKKYGGREAQKKALFAEHPKCFDDESDTLLSWFKEELERRKAAGNAPKKGRRGETPIESDEVGIGASA